MFGNQKSDMLCVQHIALRSGNPFGLFANAINHVFDFGFGFAKLFL